MWGVRGRGWRVGYRRMGTVARRLERQEEGSMRQEDGSNRQEVESRRLVVGSRSAENMKLSSILIFSIQIVQG